MQPFTEEVLEILLSIPKGRVVTYGQVAKLAGNPRRARQVSRILHSMSAKYNLPWHRVVNRNGEITIKDPDGAELQKLKLLDEDIEVENYSIDLTRFQWDI